ncbi:uncharacterized protein BJ212DRAFT_386147 [Suillus subaureus]|uniref:Uncharacterized protein n=1 Tax=Suillus subaureus TaxID=48587 RepID=A0A9P7E926_9AGAM|nr:uncharacterized protein BJ212DRAFT_386147 [Suillus subaureus]KAG1813964.1 hypothetical protein BJ212DRAFT_386147 [Suillus subaureus]
MSYAILIRYGQKVNASLMNPATILGSCDPIRKPVFSTSLETFIAYLHGLAVEVLDREQGHRRSIDDYLKLRQYTTGLKPCLFIYEMRMDLRDEVFYHPVIVDLAECITVGLCSDRQYIISYNKEQAAGNEDRNMISIIMLELGLDVTAVQWLGQCIITPQFRNDSMMVLGRFLHVGLPSTS